MPIWKQPAALFIAASVVAVLVISGAMALLASTSPLGMSAANGETSGQEESVNPPPTRSTQSAPPTFAETQTPLVTPMPPSIPPIIGGPFVNPNVGRGPLLPSTRTPVSSRFVVPQAPVSAAPGSGPLLPAPSPATPVTGPTTPPVGDPTDDPTPSPPGSETPPPTTSPAQPEPTASPAPPPVEPPVETEPPSPPPSPDPPETSPPTLAPAPDPELPPPPVIEVAESPEVLQVRL